MPTHQTTDATQTDLIVEGVKMAPSVSLSVAENYSVVMALNIVLESSVELTLESGSELLVI